MSNISRVAQVGDVVVSLRKWSGNEVRVAQAGDAVVNPKRWSREWSCVIAVGAYPGLLPALTEGRRTSLRHRPLPTQLGRQEGVAV